MNAAAKALPLLLPALALAGCAASGPFPSLAPRPAEQLSMDEPVRQAPVVATDPALSERIGALLAEAREGQARFEALLPGARSEVSEGGAPASESWIEAQQAISRLEAARAPTPRALAELDRLAIQRAQQPTNSEQFEALLRAVEAAESLALQQRAEIDRLQAALRSL